MTMCREEKRLKGGAYPRSCPTCRFGPCPNGYDYGKARPESVEPDSPKYRLDKAVHAAVADYQRDTGGAVMSLFAKEGRITVEVV